MPFNFTPLELPGLVLIEPKIFRDDRGFFAETFKLSDFENNGIECHFVQDNHSNSQRDVLRGLHYQANPKAQGKLIRVLKGSVFDVVVDLRIDSPTYGKSINLVLNDENNNMLWIPAGFAHGFCVLSETVDFIYKCTNYYDPAAERGIRWDDATLNIPWPTENPILSAKDTCYPSLQDVNQTELVRYKA